MAICRNPNCEQENADNLIYCKYCGRRLKEPKNNSKKPMMILIGIGMIIVLGILSKVLLGAMGQVKIKTPENKVTPNPAVVAGNNGVLGYKYAFIKTEGTAREVYLQNADGTISKVTTSGAVNSKTSLSPDGTKIAFERKEGNLTNIYVINTNGTGEKKLIEGHEPTWSPNSGSILFYNKSANSSSNILFMIRTDGTGLAELTATSDSYYMARYSPDGTKIAISKNSIEGYGIYMVSPDLTGRKTLIVSEKQQGEPAWSTDGSKIAYVSYKDGNAEIYTVDVNKNVYRVTTNTFQDTSPSFTADGKIIFTRQEAGGISLYIIDSDGKNEKLLLKDAGFASIAIK